MSEALPSAVQLAMLEKAHRQAVEDVMQADMDDVERVARILAMEAEFLGHMEQVRAAPEASPAPVPAESNGRD